MLRSELLEVGAEQAKSREVFYSQLQDIELIKGNQDRELEKMYNEVQELSDALMEAEAVQKEEIEALAADAEAKTIACMAKKEEELQQLTNEIELLKAELNAANECIEDETQQLKTLQDQTTGEIAELVARLEIAAQELTAQQKAIEHMKEEERGRSNAADSNGSMIAEMNALLEGKIDAEARAQKAESDSHLLQQQLSTYDRNTAEEQEIIMKVAESEMKSMQTLLQTKLSDLEAAAAREKHLCSVSSDYKSQVADLEDAIEVKDQRIAHLELSKLTQDQMDKIKLLKEEHKKSREDVKTMKKQLSQLKKAYDDLKDSSLAGPSAASSGAIAAAHTEISSLNTKLQETTTRLESAQVIVKTLKEKIRDCSKQLQARSLLLQLTYFDSLMRFLLSTSRPICANSNCSPI